MNETAQHTLAARLTEAMTAARLNQRQLAERVTQLSGERLSQVAIQKIKSGKTARSKRLPDIAQALGVTVEWLARGQQELSSSTSMISVTGAGELAPHLDVGRWAVKWGSVQVTGIARLNDDGSFVLVSISDEPAGVLKVSSPDPNAYALRVLGDSLSPRIRHGEYVLVEPGHPPVEMEEVVVILTDGRRMVRIYVGLQDGFYRLDPINQNGLPMHIDVDLVAAVHYVGGILKPSRFLHL